MVDKNRVVVVGAGVGGMAAALLLAVQGLDVTLVEAAATPGGKLRQVQSGGVWQDAGPTVFTMRWVFDALFADAGVRLQDHLQLHPVDTLARHAWDGESRLDLFADIGRSQDAIAQFSGPAQARHYGEFCKRAQRTYQTLEHTFMRASRPNPFSLASRAGLRGLPDLARIAPFTSLWRALGDHFSDPRLRQLFGRYATYCGASPFLAPATLMLVAHVEQSGVWLVKGGMYRIALALEHMLKRHGVHVRYHAPVARVLVSEGQVTGVRLADGEVISAGAVVFNGDVAALSGGLLGPESVRAVPRRAPSRRSLSAVTWHMVAPAKGFSLLHHTVFFSGNYADEFSCIRGSARLPQDPTVYVCAQDRNDIDSVQPVGAERIMCLVNAAATADTNPLAPSAVAQCKERMLEKLAGCGLQLGGNLDDAVVTTPADFHRMFPGTGGALYGAASHGWMASFSRPGSRCRVRGLYLAGGSTHPGPGLPMAALSGRQAAQSVLHDLDQACARGRR